MKNNDEVTMPYLASLRRHAILSFSLVCAACASSSRETPADGAGDSNGDQHVLESHAECSEIRPRDVILRLRWPAGVKTSSARIEISTHKDGFTTGRFVWATLVELQTVPPSGVSLRAPETKSPATAPLNSLGLRVDSQRPVHDGTLSEVVVSGLNPGVNYYLRLSSNPAETVRLQAPICPVDFIDGREETRK